MKTNLHTQILAIGLLFYTTFISANAYAHDPGYQDFYNAKQGSMQADSGCRLLVCLANPKGPMSEPKCAQDIQSMYTEIALQATYWHGHAWIPQCTGLNGQNMRNQVNANGQNAGSYAKHERFNVLRKVERNRWEIIYSSLRSPAYFPVVDADSGQLVTSDTPNHIWNATPSGFGKQNLTYDGSGSTLGNNGSSNGQTSLTTTIKVTEKDITKVIEDPTIHLFQNQNYANRSVKEFEQAVIASKEEGTILSVPPVGSFFARGDKITFNEVPHKDGEHPETRKTPANKFTITTPGKDGKPVTNTIELQFGQAPVYDKNGNHLKTQDVIGVNTDIIDPETLKPISVPFSPQYSINTTSTPTVSVEPSNFSLDENTGSVTYEDVDGKHTISSEHKENETAYRFDGNEVNINAPQETIKTPNP